MYPILTVEGKELNVINVGYFNNEIASASVLDQGGNVVIYTEQTHGHYIEEQLRFDAATQLKWKGQHDEIIVALEKRIEAHEERMSELAYEFMQLAISSDAVFPEIEAKALKEEFEVLMLQTEGLVEAKRIIMVERESIATQFVEGVKAHVEQSF